MASVKREVPCIHLYFAFKPRQKLRKCLSLGRPSCIWSLGRYHVLFCRGNTEPPTKHRPFDGATAWSSSALFPVQKKTFHSQVLTEQSFEVYLVVFCESSHIWHWPETIGKCSRCEQRHDERVVGSRKHEIGRIEAFFKEKCKRVFFGLFNALVIEDLPSGWLV